MPLAPGITTFTGFNGQGKTNLVEAAAYLATFGSHRVATDAPLIRQGADRAILRAVVVSAGRDSLLEIEINAGRANRVRLNRAPVPRPREVLGVLRCVLFAPEDIAVVKGDPDQRRRYLDDLLVAMRPRYAGRPRRLRPGAQAADGAAEVGQGQGRGARRGAGGLGRSPGHRRRTADGRPGCGLVGELRDLVARSYSAVSGTERDTDLRYRMSAAGPTVGAAPESTPTTAPRARSSGASRAASRSLSRTPRSWPGRCGRRWPCGAGPSWNGPSAWSGRTGTSLSWGSAGLPARGYASHGESWSLALALRLAGYQLLRAGGDDPVLMLDDVFAELDSARRERLAELVADAEQVLVTAAVPEDVPAGLSGARFDVADGVVTRV